MAENGLPVKNETGFKGYVPQKYRKNNEEKKPLWATFIAFLITLGFIGIQILAMLPFMFGGMLKAASDYKESASDVTQEEVMDVMMRSVNSVDLTVLATAISLVVAVIWYKYVYCRYYKINDFKVTCKRIITPFTVCGIIMGAVFLFYVCDFLVVLIGVISPDTLDNYEKLIEKSNFNTLDWKIIICTVILAPINEECIMRGIILKRLMKDMRPSYAILISSVLFGLFHMNIVQGIYAAALGFFMGYLAYKYHSILASIIFHAVFNALNYVLLLLPETIVENRVISIFVPVVAGVLWFFLECRRKSQKKV